ncbi:hypothetical protein [Streptomyces sp. TS71-3]|uniref:hypothetical protein n=1 Tax=Streptomyces sp. TS71-3 TaxID=2733862 RepID=UPI001B1D890A|nr:hypothetical protein [Streptomyces sp. TS71-3]GHJ37099.1 hypothetical protein Sm713_27080 [Streptomyces sp. TS71-3]
MLETGVVAAVVAWLCRRAVLSAGRTLAASLSVPEDAEGVVDAAADAVARSLAGDTAYEQLQREAGDPEREEPSELTRRRVALAVEDAVGADPELAAVIDAAYTRWRAARGAGSVTATEGGVAAGGDVSVTASGAGAIAVGGSASGPVTSNAPAAPAEPGGGATGTPPAPGPQPS